MMINKALVSTALIIVGGGTLGFMIARHHYNVPTIKMYSDMTSQIQGKKIYLIDTPVTCPNSMALGPDGKPQMKQGRQLGELKVDINLQSGSLSVVKNTVPAVFTCP